MKKLIVALIICLCGCHSQYSRCIDNVQKFSVKHPLGLRSSQIEKACSNDKDAAWFNEMSERVMKQDNEMSERYSNRELTGNSSGTK